MSWVAEANAVIQKMTRVNEKSDTGVPETASPEDSPAMEMDAGSGSENATTANAADIMTCMETTHHLLVRIISTNGDHSGLITHGRYSNPVYMAISPFPMPSFLNMITEITFTMKYGIPSAKYSVGTHSHGDRFMSLFLFIFPFFFHVILSVSEESGSSFNLPPRSFSSFRMTSHRFLIPSACLSF